MVSEMDIDSHTNAYYQFVVRQIEMFLLAPTVRLRNLDKFLRELNIICLCLEIVAAEPCDDAP